MNIFLSIFAFIIIFIILFFLYIKIKHPFWAIQPVFHFYDMYYWIYNVGIIRHDLPCKNKYTNFTNIETQVFDLQKENRQIKQFILFIQKHYLRNKDNIFCPKRENVAPYFTGHKYPCFISYYYEKVLLEDFKNSCMVEDKKMIGVITSRPLNVYLNKNHFYVYYVDYLCVDKAYRNKNIAPQLIQTYEYNARHKNKEISVHLFKREDVLTGIIPLTVYKTYCFSMEHWTTPDSLHPLLSFVMGDSQNMYYVWNFLKEHMDKWKITILPEISNMIELVKSNNIFVTMILSEKEIIAVYFFKKVCTALSKGKEVISCFASIQGSKISLPTFIHGFKVSLSTIVKKHIFHYLCVENISDNHILINHLVRKNKPVVVSDTAYFFYNFAYETFPSQKVFLLN